ncbi:MAG: orotate phosphoribosyltransferase [Cuniculiplasma sp.]
MLQDMLVQYGAVKRGRFTLTSGKESEFYVDIKDACARPEILKEIVNQLDIHVKGDAVAGVELGAVPLVVAYAYHKSKPYFIIRKGSDHGLKKLLVGNIEPGMKLDIIEDVVTTGGSVLRAANILREAGLEVKRAIVVVDREEGGKELLEKNGIELVPLVRLGNLL